MRVFAYGSTKETPKDLLAIMKKRVAQRSAAEKKKLADFRNQAVKTLAKTVIPKSAVYALAFSADGNRLAAAGADGIIRLINTTSGEIDSSFSPVPTDSMMDAR